MTATAKRAASTLEQLSYMRLRDIYAERINSIVFWCGAGLSRPASLPTWSELRSTLEKEVESKASSLDADGSRKLTRDLAAVRNQRNQWLAFQRLKEVLGRTSYTAAVRHALSTAVKAPPPAIYARLWTLRPKGILNLNLDGFATRAAPQAGAGAVAEFQGRFAGQHAHLLKAQRSFVANLHGMIDDESSWVFGKDELTKLLQNSGYRSFIDTVFSTTTIVFLGLSADDVAVGGLLDDLRQRGTDPGQHFWVTSRRDSETDTWAEKTGVQVIRYNSSSGHDDALNDLFSDLERYRPSDAQSEPVLPSAPRTSFAPPVGVDLTPSELATRPPEEIRQILSFEARRILEEDRSDRYEEFCKKHSRALHNAWYVELESPNNVLFGHTLNDRIGDGAFGTVYGATTRDGRDVAIKLLRQEVRDSKDMLGSFRRGVRSMKFLRDRQLVGVVPYLEAYELPPCVVMERIFGPNLEAVVQSKRLEAWPDGLRILTDVANTVHLAHCMPERVLHRDLRPANIMLKHFDQSKDDWSVVVLDFDLSWHLGATEKSIVDFSAGAALGYLAPEQLTPGKASTRNTAVDAYGLAMTAYFVFAGQHPRPGEALAAEWTERVHSAAARYPCVTWRSAPNRLARLILSGTRQRQADRLDMAHLRGGLQRLLEAVVTPGKVESPDMWAEELMQLAFPDDGYAWNEDNASARVESPSGWSLETVSNPTRSAVDVIVKWTHTGIRDRRTLSRHVREMGQKLGKVLRHGGWTVEGTDTSGETVVLQATASVAAVIPNAHRLAESLQITQKEAAQGA